MPMSYSSKNVRSSTPPSPADRTTVYASLLAADTYSEQARDALIDGDDDAAAHALAVLRGIVAVVTGKLRGSSSEKFGTRK
jgi:hypothetical protein